jgi:putative transposase
LKNRVLLENYYLSGDLEAQTGHFIEHDNQHFYHETLGNLPSANFYFGRCQEIPADLRPVKRQTLEHRQLLHKTLVA